MSPAQSAAGWTPSRVAEAVESPGKKPVLGVLTFGSPRSVSPRILIHDTWSLCGNQAVVLAQGLEAQESNAGAWSSPLAGLLPCSMADVLNSGTTSKTELGAFPCFLLVAFPFSMRLSESVEGHSRCVSWEMPWHPRSSERIPYRVNRVT